MERGEEEDPLGRKSSTWQRRSAKVRHKGEAEYTMSETMCDDGITT